jgi:hypothetical protein
MKNSKIVILVEKFIQDFKSKVDALEVTTKEISDYVAPHGVCPDEFTVVLFKKINFVP